MKTTLKFVTGARSGTASLAAGVDKRKTQTAKDAKIFAKNAKVF
jgi:hypothetical protein